MLCNTERKVNELKVIWKGTKKKLRNENLTTKIENALDKNTPPSLSSSPPHPSQISWSMKLPAHFSGDLETNFNRTQRKEHRKSRNSMLRHWHDYNLLFNSLWIHFIGAVTIPSNLWPSRLVTAYYGDEEEFKYLKPTLSLHSKILSWSRDLQFPSL